VNKRDSTKTFKLHSKLLTSSAFINLLKLSL